jgi:hypothetical protein
MKGAAQVNRDHGVPFFNREVLDSGDMLNACVVDQNVNLAKLRRSIRHHVFDVGGLAHVGAVVRHLHAQRGNFGLGALHIAKAIKNYVGTLRGQRFGNAQADTTGGAGDERCFTFEHEVSPDDLRWLKRNLGSASNDALSKKLPIQLSSLLKAHQSTYADCLHHE